MNWSSEGRFGSCVILPTVGVLLAFVGLGLSLCNWAALLAILLPIGAAFIHRMNVEEDALSRALGPRYAEYMKRTKRLVPFVY
jgi:protein-S-isoprenylcysteine O-methyltransferase Ste14